MKAIKARTINMTQGEFMAVRLGLAEVEYIISSGSLTGEELIQYDKHAKNLDKLIGKFIKAE